MQSYSTLRRLTCCLLLPAFLAGCSSWWVQEVSPQQLITEDQPEKIRVTLTDGSQMVLEQPRVSGDTLMGKFAPKDFAPSAQVQLKRGEQVNIPLSDVTDVAIQKTDPGKIFGMVLVVGAFLFGALIVAIRNSLEDCCI